MDKKIVMGIDIGGSHISASLVDIEHRRLLAGEPERREVDSAGQVDAVIGEWSKVIERSFNGIAAKDRRIGIAMPGPVDYEEGICYIRDQHKYEHLYGLNLKGLLAAALGIDRSQIRMINDAAGFLAGEIFAGAGRGYDTVLGLTLGTGLGSALCQSGVITDADLWHSPFMDGKAEDYLSGPWLVSQAKGLTGHPFRNVREMATAAPDSAVIRGIFAEFGANLGQFLAPQIRRTGSSMVVLGGNISRAEELFLPSVNAALQEQGTVLPVVRAKIGGSAALIGAAALWKHEPAMAVNNE